MQNSLALEKPDPPCFPAAGYSKMLDVALFPNAKIQPSLPNYFTLTAIFSFSSPNYLTCLLLSIQPLLTSV